MIRIISKGTRFLSYLSGVTLFLLMSVTCIDVAGRYFLNKPLTGSTELTEVSLAVMLFLALPHISWRNEHIVVDILDIFISEKINVFRMMAFNILMSIALACVGYRIIVLGNRSLKYEEVTEYLSIPVGWVINFTGGVCMLTACVLIAGLYPIWVFYKNNANNENE